MKHYNTKDFKLNVDDLSIEFERVPNIQYVKSHIVPFLQNVIGKENITIFDRDITLLVPEDCAELLPSTISGGECTEFPSMYWYGNGSNTLYMDPSEEFTLKMEAGIFEEYFSANKHLLIG